MFRLLQWEINRLMMETIYLLNLRCWNLWRKNRIPKNISCHGMDRMNSLIALHDIVFG